MCVGSKFVDPLIERDLVNGGGGPINKFPLRILRASFPPSDTIIHRQLVFARFKNWLNGTTD